MALDQDAMLLLMWEILPVVGAVGLLAACVSILKHFERLDEFRLQRLIALMTERSNRRRRQLEKFRNKFRERRAKKRKNDEPCSICCDEDVVARRVSCCQSPVCVSCDATWMRSVWTQQGNALHGLCCPACTQPLAGTPTEWAKYAHRLEEAIALDSRLLSMSLQSAVAEANPDDTVHVCPRAICGAVTLVSQACFGCTLECAACNAVFRVAPTRFVDAADQVSLAIIQRSTIPCGGCFRPLRRDGGCSTIQCVSCKVETCWSCGAVGVHHSRGR